MVGAIGAPSLFQVNEPPSKRKFKRKFSLANPFKVGVVGSLRLKSDIGGEMARKPEKATNGCLVEKPIEIVGAGRQFRMKACPFENHSSNFKVAANKIIFDFFP